VLTLHNLSKPETVSFFRYTSQRKRLDWNENFIQMLAASTEGYPLLMKERLYREIGVPLRKSMSKKRNLKGSGRKIEPYPLLFADTVNELITVDSKTVLPCVPYPQER
jgi:hypothetical protein